MLPPVLFQHPDGISRFNARSTPNCRRGWESLRLVFAYTGLVPVCVVSFTDTESVRHSVEVEARSLYEAAALALAEFRSSGVIEEIGPATRLSIVVRRPETVHELAVGKVEAWLQSNAKNPAEQALKGRLKCALK